MAIGDATAYSRLRRDLGVDEVILPDDEAELLFVESDETYPDNAAKRAAYTRVIGILSLLPGGARSGRYVQNQSEEDQRGLFANLRQWLQIWQERVAMVTDVATTTAGSFFFTSAPGQRGR